MRDPVETAARVACKVLRELSYSGLLFYKEPALRALPCTSVSAVYGTVAAVKRRRKQPRGGVCLGGVLFTGTQGTLLFIAAVLLDDL